MTAEQIASATREGPMILAGVLLDFPARLAPEILDEERVYPRASGSVNRGGWKSTDVMFRRLGTAAYAWRTYIEGVRLGRARINPWAMVNRRGSEHPRHQHRITKTSGIYYVTVGDPAVPTVFETKAGEVSIMPAPGLLILFPGEMWHRVPRYDGHDPRITIAFDVVG